MKSHAWPLVARLARNQLGLSQTTRSDWCRALAPQPIPIADVVEEAPNDGGWRGRFARATGVASNEGLAYRLEELCRLHLMGRLDDDDQIADLQRQDLRPFGDWSEEMRAIAGAADVQDELWRSLLVLALWADDEAILRFVDDLGDLDANQGLREGAAWVGHALASAWLTENRLRSLADDGQAFPLLAHLGRTDLLQRHLQAAGRDARPGDDAFGHDALLAWYQQCGDLPGGEQIACLRTYVDGIGTLVVKSNGGPAGPLDALSPPIAPPSSALRHARSKTADRAVDAARQGDHYRALLWVRCVLTHAYLGPDRWWEPDVVNTLARCGGVVLASSPDDVAVEAWSDWIREASRMRRARSPWNALLDAALDARQDWEPTPGLLSARDLTGRGDLAWCKWSRVAATWNWRSRSGKHSRSRCRAHGCPCGRPRPSSCAVIQKDERPQPRCCGTRFGPRTDRCRTPP